jgi:predicted nuclease of predicted toxin-antitoxin system
VKFKLDENLPGDLGALLRGEGHDVTDVVEEGLAGEKDPSVLAAATGEGRTLMTFDLDFADVRTYPPGSHSGIVVFRLKNRRWKTLEGPLRRFLAECSLHKLEQGLAIVDEVRIRYKAPRRMDPHDPNRKC